MNYDKLILLAVLGYLIVGLFTTSFVAKPEIAEPIAAKTFAVHYLKEAKAEPNTSITVVLNPQKNTIAHAGEHLERNKTLVPYVGECNLVRLELQTQVTSFWLPIIRSDSMYPCLNPAQVSAVELATPATYWYSRLQVGDVVNMDITQQEQTYYSVVDGETRKIIFVLHRIVAKTDKGFVTKGDNNVYNDAEYFDTYLTPETYKGVVINLNQAK